MARPALASGPPQSSTNQDPTPASGTSGSKDLRIMVVHRHHLPVTSQIGPHDRVRQRRQLAKPTLLWIRSGLLGQPCASQSCAQSRRPVLGVWVRSLPGTLHEQARWRTAAVCRVEVARLISYRDCLRSDFRCLRRPEVSLQGGLAACRGGPSARAKLSSPRSRSRCGIGVILGEDGADLGLAPSVCRTPRLTAAGRRCRCRPSSLIRDKVARDER